MEMKLTILQKSKLFEMQSRAEELALLVDELERQDTPSYIQQTQRQRSNAFKTLKTPKEKILFFYRYFLSSQNKSAQENAICLAYAMTYLSENTELVKADDPFEIASYFELDKVAALEKLFKEKLGKTFEKYHGKPYNNLLKPVEGQPFSDEYKLQCLIIAYCPQSLIYTGFGLWPYTVYPKSKNS